VNNLRLNELLAGDGDLDTVLGRLSMRDSRVHDLEPTA
jgi:hypothetical protein